MDDLLSILKGLAGPAGGAIAAVFAYLWKSERDERMSAQKDLFDLGKKSVEADFTVAKSIDGLTNSLNALVGALRK